ncbi:MAG: M48 family metalloprotease [Chromatiales bacterium]|nr:M48 family metalloprotease [Chromatiales bacterium]
MNQLKKQFCYLFICLASVQATAQPYALPDISDPSYAVMSLAEERKLGRVILAEARAQLPIIEDIEIQSYLRQLGQRILAHSKTNHIDFHFLLIKNPTINAFATPGGVLAFNDGLVLVSENESELGGVVAHEIAHVSQRHIARRQALSSGSGLISSLSIIGAIIAAAYNSELAELTLFGSAALPVERQLSHSRNFEYEADRFGMQLMAAAGLDPWGMPAFFEKLQRKESRGLQIEFLRTHPLTISRLSEAQQRAASYRKTFTKDRAEFQYAKARLLTISKISESPQHADEDIQNYHRALVLIERQQPRQALEYLEKIPVEQHHIPVKLAFAHAYRIIGNWDKAIAILDELNELHPGRAAIIYYLALALFKSGQQQKALAEINAVAALHNYYPQFYTLGAQAASQLGQNGVYHEYLADYYTTEGRLEAALQQLTLAERSNSLHHSIRARIAAKRKDIEEFRKEMSL